MNDKLAKSNGRNLDMDYFIQWRTWLWRKPTLEALAYLGDLKGKRLLHIGDWPGRMTSLFALQGAQVTVIDVIPFDRGWPELAKWSVADRVKFIQTSGGFAELGDQRFDLVFAKSVLWAVKDLAGFLDGVDEHLDANGRFAFVDNAFGPKLLAWARTHLMGARLKQREALRFGVKPGQFALFRQRFDDVVVGSHLGLIYRIQGSKRPGRPRQS